MAAARALTAGKRRDRKEVRIIRKLQIVALTVVRIGLGIFWLWQQTWKPPPAFGCPTEGFCYWLDQEIQHPLIPLYADFLRTVVRPQAYVFGWITLLTETAIGLSFLLGALTRLGGLVGTLWSLNLLVGLIRVPGEEAWYYIGMVLVNCLYLVVGGSSQLSVDRAKGWRNWLARAD